MRAILTFSTQLITNSIGGSMDRFSTLLFFALISHLFLSYGKVDGSILSQKDLEINRYLKIINKPATKTIKSPAGELIDCVDIYKQPAFDHPLLLNHTIQMKPSFNLSNTHKEEPSIEIHQPWHANGKCLQGTIPIRRIQKVDLLRATSPEKFGKKHRQYTLARGKTDPQIIGTGHEHAIARQEGGQYYGANVDINLWRPIVNPKDFSLAQIWVVSDNSNSLTTLEVGVMVYPVLYGDYETRLFIYWTADGYMNTGCYNLVCSGFIQTSNEISFGMMFTPTSSYGGNQYELNIKIHKDQMSGNWWLIVQGKELGYWPTKIVPELGESANVVDSGGEIFNNDYQLGSTTTQMGSGHFAKEGFAKAAYIRNIQVVDANGDFQEPASLQILAEEPKCYDSALNDTSSFYFGGPGKSANCP